MKQPEVHIGPLVVNASFPRVVGILSRMDSAKDFLKDTALGCDLIELRLDRMDIAENPDWSEVAQSIQAVGYPVIATLRLPSEGGAWNGTDEERRPFLQQAMKLCGAVDIELQSNLFENMAAAALEANKTLIVSYHDFKQTPPIETLREVIRRAAIHERVIVKIAAQINQPDDIAVLEELLAAPASAPLCVIGMGALGQSTRVEFPRRGSCLAYGHIDESTAPGQWSCSALVQKLHAGSQGEG